MANALIVGTGDVHIDSGRFGGINPATGIRRAHEHTHQVWMSICRTAIERRADAVTIAGDIYGNGWPRPEPVEMVADGVRLLSEAGVPCVIFDGNHEWINRPAGHRSPLEHLQDLPGVYVVLEPHVVILPSGIQIACMPWPRRSELLEPGEVDGLAPEDIDNLVADRAVERIERLADDVDPGRGPTILAAHATVGDAIVGSTRRGSEMALAELFAEPVIPLDDLDRDPWQHVLLSHIHRRQQMGERCWYAGSPDRLDFSDQDIDKAVSAISVPDDGTIADVDAWETPARRFATIVVPDGCDAADLANLVPADPVGVVAKIELPAGADMALASQARRVAEAAGMAVARVIAPPPPRPDSPERAAVAEDVGPLDGLAVWLDSRGIAGDAAARLRAKAATLLDANTDSGPQPLTPPVTPAA